MLLSDAGQLEQSNKQALGNQGTKKSPWSPAFWNPPAQEPHVCWKRNMHMGELASEL